MKYKYMYVSRGFCAVAVHEVHGILVFVEARGEGVVLTNGQTIPPDVRHGRLREVVEATVL